MTQTIISHGVPIIPGKITCSNFIKEFAKKSGSNSYYDKSWEELEKLVKENFNNNEPGTGSIDGDVLLVNVPPHGFHTSIIEITNDNRHLVEEIFEPRVEGEKPVITRVIRGLDKPPAKFVKIVIYRADVLAKDSDRSSDAEWEIVAILAQDEEHVPMTPNTMLRNNNHEKGGTYREYTDAEWEEAYNYWDNHAKIIKD